MKFGEISILGYRCGLIKYIEEVDQDTRAMGINAIIVIDRKIFRELRYKSSKTEYFPVIPPKGSLNNPINMRFGKIIWSEDKSLIRARISLVEDKYDRREHYTAFDCLEPELSNVRLMAAQNKSYIYALENILLAKNILSVDELEIVRKSADNMLVNIFREIYKVEDVLKYWEYE